jgi:hypothetical protein
VDPITESQGFRDAFGFDSEQGWVILSHPNSLWVLGTIVEIKGDSPPRDIGTQSELGCFPSDHWIVESGKAPASAYSSALNYNLSLSATLGMPNADLVKAGLNLGGVADNGAPNYQTLFKVEKATEKRVSQVKIEAYLESNFDRLSRSCKRLLLAGDRYLIDKIYQIDQGVLEVASSTGTQVDLSLPQYKAIADAAATAGFQIDKSGGLTVTQPITFAVRTADFSRVLEELGIASRNPGQPSFDRAMRTVGASVAY